MDVLLIQINNSKAYQILEGLEDLKIMKVLEKNKRYHGYFCRSVFQTD